MKLTALTTGKALNNSTAPVCIQVNLPVLKPLNKAITAQVCDATGDEKRYTAGLQKMYFKTMQNKIYK